MSRTMKDLSNYISVHERISAFRKDFPEGFIDTERSDYEVEPGRVVCRFKAKVFRNIDEARSYGESGVAAATGHAELIVDGEKVVEKCETVAVGRALGLLGYEITEGIASKEEMEEYENHSERKSRRFSRDDGEYEDSSKRMESGETEEDSEEVDEKPSRFSRRTSEDDSEAPKASRFSRNGSRSRFSRQSQ